ncbi:helix-turn-helix transcriptional regulator [Leucobacter chinensis]|uniref:helix-turn-helix transcriptional regulator n=1 Tax=Leucobacter chinensis TaxID=2851010 RepID=UPI001C2182DF
MTPSTPTAGGPALKIPLHIPAVSVPEICHDDQHMAFWQVRGSTLFRHAGRSTVLHEGEVLWLPVETPHALEVRPDSVVFPYWFPIDHTATVLREPTVVRILEREQDMFLALYQSRSTIIQPGANIQRQVLSILERGASMPEDLPLPTTPTAAAVAAALLLNPGDERRAVDWALEVHTSCRSLERAFVAETGLTFREWRLRCRMHLAAKLLRSDASVTSVAFRVGYQHPNSFARTFRGFYGVSPTSFAAEPAGPETVLGSSGTTVGVPVT